MNRLFAPLMLAAAIALPHAAAAQQAPVPPLLQPVQPRIMVTGEGEASVAPDMAIVTLAVMREAPTAREALDQNNEAMQAVIAAMKEAGVAERDLQTAGLQINPRYVYPQNGNGGEQPKIVGYEVTNTLTVRIRDIASVGEIIDRSVDLGVNQGGSIVFTNEDPAEATTEARRMAVEDAMARARTLAEAAGVELGPIVELAEHSAPPPPMPLGAPAYRMEAADASVPIEVGENTYTVQVSVTFELRQ